MGYVASTGSKFLHLMASSVNAENNQQDSGVHGILFRPADAMEPTLAGKKARVADSKSASLRPLSDSVEMYLAIRKSVLDT